MDSAASKPVRRGGLRALVLAPRVPPFLSLALLACQTGVIWFARGWPTQDGSSHIYTTWVLRELLFHRGSAVSSLFALNSYPTSNWTSMLLLGVADLLLGPVRGEQAIASVAVLSLYGAMYWAQKALAPEGSILWPGMNAVLNVWFLYMGFYSFYLGMALSVFCLGYYLRHRGHLRARHYVWIGVLNVALYFTHPMAQVFAALTICTVSLWENAIGSSGAPGAAAGPARRVRAALRSLAPLLAAMAPGAGLLLVFMRQERLGPGQFASPLNELGSRLLISPANLFTIFTDDSSTHLSGALCALLLLAIVGSVILWKRTNWRSAQGGLLLAIPVMLVVYVLTREHSGEAAYVKERLAWGVLVFALVTVSVRVRFRAWFSILALFLLPFVGAHSTIGAVAARMGNRAREQYWRLEPLIRPGASIFRLNYPALRFEQESGLARLSPDPTLHALDTLALRRRCLNWSSYEAASKAFPVVYRSLTDGEKKLVTEFEEHDAEKAENLNSFLGRHGNTVEYIIVYGELPEPGRPTEIDADLEEDFRATLELLGREYELVADSRDGPPLRLFKKRIL